MSEAEPPFRILSIASTAQAPVMIAAGRRFAAAVGEALGRPWPSELAFARPDAPPPPAGMLLLSLTDHVESRTPLTQLEANWGRFLDQLAGRRVAVVVPTIYRHVADRERRPALIERCRRINMAIVALSRRHGIEVADVDRAFSLIGAEAAGGDYHCLGARAAALAGHVLAEAMLGCDLAPHLDAETQERALALLAQGADGSGIAREMDA